jgi:hypothetical protein
MPKYDVRENIISDNTHDVVDAATGEVVIVNDTWLGALPFEDADDVADLLNVVHARRGGLLN